MSLARRFHLRRNEARALLTLASLHQQQGATEAVLRETEPALAFYKQAGFRQETILCLTLIARANRDRGKDAEALAAFEQQLALGRATDDRPQMAIAEQGVASVLLQQERWPEALGHYERYYELARSIPDRDGTGRGLVGRANVLWRLGRYREAEEVLAEAETLAGSALGSSPLAPLIAERRAAMALSRGSYREAATKARQILDMPAANAPTRADAKCVVGLALARSGAARDGRLLCREAMADIAARGDKFALADARLDMSEILLAAGEPQAAQEQVRLALEVFEAAGHREAG